MAENSLHHNLRCLRVFDSILNLLCLNAVLARPGPDRKTREILEALLTGKGAIPRDWRLVDPEMSMSPWS